MFMFNFHKTTKNIHKLNEYLCSKIADLEVQLDVENRRRADLDNELGRLRQEMAQQLQEYQDLMDIKTSLDMELAAYDKL